MALLEETIAVTLTNLAPWFGSQPGKAYVTASSNYVHVVLFHSVFPLIVPWIIAWAWLLDRYDFSPGQVLLLFGLLGTLAESTLDPAALVAGFWFFVYGLMVFLPAYSIPSSRRVRRPGWQAYCATIVVPIISCIPALFLAGITREALGIQFYTDIAG